MNLAAEFSRRQIIGLLEKAVVDRKLPDTLLFQFESCVSWPFTKAQEQILLSYATVDNLKKSAEASASTVKTLGKLANGGSLVDDPLPSAPLPNGPSGSDRWGASAASNAYVYSPPPREVVRTVYVQQPVSHEPRYSKGEWERIQKAEKDKEIAKAKVFPKEPTLNKYYRKIETEIEVGN